jgi:hypothetical protein
MSNDSAVPPAHPHGPLFGALALGLALGTPALAQDTPQLQFNPGETRSRYAPD